MGIYGSTVRYMKQRKGVVQGDTWKYRGYIEKGWCMEVRSKIFKEYSRLKGSIFRYIRVQGDYMGV